MKPDWDLLAEHFQDETSVFIADVNCQMEESLCSGYHTGGTYPTILIFPPPPRNGQQRPPAQLYQGGRGFEDLRKFVDRELVQPCRVQDAQATCSEKARTYILKWVAKSQREQETELVRLRSMLASTNTDSLTYDLSKWLTDRIAILEQLLTAGGKNEEL